MKTNRLLAQLHYVPRVFAMIWSAAKLWTIAWVVLLIVQSILPILNVLLTRDAVNNVAYLLRYGWIPEQLPQKLLPVFGFGILQIFSNATNSVASWIRLGQSECVRDYVSALIQAQAVRLDMSYFEQQNFYDLMHRVRTEARDRPLMLLENTGMLVKSVLSIIGLAGLLFAYGAWLLPVLVVGALPAVWAVIRFSRRLSRWRIESTPRERRAFYFDLLLMDRISAPEIRLFDLGGHYGERFREVRQGLRSERLRLWRGKSISDILVTTFSTLVGGTILLWMGWRVLIGTAPVGDFAALYQIFTQVQDALGSIVSRAGDIYQSLLFLEDLFVFLDLEPRLVDQGATEAPPLQHEIRFENITFRYPGSEREALKNFSMTVPAGRVVALVGENGEGKTSLMKLLCRFYDPTEGTIYWDGIDLRQLSTEGLQRQITMLFQTPFNYQESVRQNIAVSHIKANPSPDAVQKAAELAGAHDFVQRLPQGYETVLGKWFGGEELSIGQWQRVALARAFLRPGSVIILDEPTSAMDAWSEIEWLARVRGIAQGRTLIMITHRFTTAMQADQIFVLHKQRIVEQGTHAELIALGGRYATAWHEQMRESGETRPESD